MNTGSENITGRYPWTREPKKTGPLTKCIVNMVENTTGSLPSFTDLFKAGTPEHIVANTIVNIQEDDGMLFEYDGENVTIYAAQETINHIQMPNDIMEDVLDFFEELSKTNVPYHPANITLSEPDVEGEVIITHETPKKKARVCIDTAIAHKIHAALLKHTIFFWGQEDLHDSKQIQTRRSESIATIPKSDWDTFIKTGQMFFYALCEDFLQKVFADEKLIDLCMQEMKQKMESRSFEKKGKFITQLQNWRWNSHDGYSTSNIRWILMETINKTLHLRNLREDFENRLQNADIFSMAGKGDAKEEPFLPNDFQPLENKNHNWEYAIQWGAIQEISHEVMLFILEHEPDISNEKLKKQTKKLTRKLQKVFMDNSLARGGSFVKRTQEILTYQNGVVRINNENRKQLEEQQKQDNAIGCPIKGLTDIWTNMTEKYIDLLVSKRTCPEETRNNRDLGLNEYL